MRFLTAIFFITGIWIGMFGVPENTYALSTSTAEIVIDTPLKADDKISVTASIGRDYGQTGALTIEVSPRGSCGGCISSATYFVIPSSTQNYSFPLTVSAGNLTEGTYTQLVAFYLYTEAGAGSGSASATIQQGITIAIKFSVAAGVNASTSSSTSSSSGGGGGSTGSTASKTTSSDDAASEADASTSEEGASDKVSDDATTDTATAEEDSKTEASAPSEDSVTTEADTSDGETFISEGPTVSTESSTVTTEIFSAPSAENATSTDDKSITMNDFFSESCTEQCDVNDDGTVSFTDIVQQYVYFSPEVSDAVVVEPPVAAGPPLETDDVMFTFEPGGIVGEYDFHLTSVAEETQSDIVTFYLLAHTGVTGILAAEIQATFDPLVMQFVGMDTAGSVFPYAYQSYEQAEQGVIHFGGVTQSAFIGTNGYVAAFHFMPLVAGAVKIAFQDVAVYQPNIVEAATLDVKDIEGIFVAPKPEEEVIENNENIPEEVVQGVALQHSWIILVLLGMIASMGLVGALYCFAIREQKK